MVGSLLVGRVGFEPTITGARDQYPVRSNGISTFRPCCPHSLVVWTTAPEEDSTNEGNKSFNRGQITPSGAFFRGVVSLPDVSGLRPTQSLEKLYRSFGNLLLPAHHETNLADENPNIVHPFDPKQICVFSEDDGLFAERPSCSLFPCEMCLRMNIES